MLAPHAGHYDQLRLFREEPEALGPWSPVPGHRAEVQRPDLQAPKSPVSSALAVRLCLRPDAAISPLRGDPAQRWVAWRESRDPAVLDVLMATDLSAPRTWSNPQHALAELGAAGAIAHIDPALTMAAQALVSLGISKRLPRLPGPSLSV